MARRLARILGVTVAALAVIGLLAGDRQIFGFINIDLGLDILRIPIAAALLYAGFGTRDDDISRSIVLGVGVLFVGMAILGMFSSELFGFLPNRLSEFDVVFHLVSGVICLAAGLTHTNRRYTAASYRTR